MTADAFGLDLAWSPDMAIGLPYTLVVVLGIWWPDRNYILTAAVAGSLLCLAGFYYSFSRDLLWMGLVNRGFALALIWIVAVLCLHYKKVKTKAVELKRFSDFMGQVCSETVTPNDEDTLYKKILDCLLAFTQSRCGVLYAVIKNPEGKPGLGKKTGLTWNPQFPEPQVVSSLNPASASEKEIYNLAPLLEEVLHSGNPLLMKHVSSDLRGGALSSVHPPIESFMGLPLYLEGNLLAVVGVANQRERYDESRVKHIVPLLSACAIRIHAFSVGQDRFETEKAFKESRAKLKGMEKDAADLQFKILEKEALLDQGEEEFSKIEKTLKEQEHRLLALAENQGKGEEEFNRLQESLNRLLEEKGKTEERLSDKEAQIEKAEEDRNRTASALWEKEQRLTDVLDDLSLTENELSRVQEKVASFDLEEEELEQIQDQLHESNDRLASMENRFKKTQEELGKKEKLLERLEFKMFEVESQVQQMNNTLRDREGLLEKIEKQIHESLRGNLKTDVPRKLDRILPEQKEQQNLEIEESFPPKLDTNKTQDRPEPLVPQDPDLGRIAEEQTVNPLPLDQESGDDKVKTRFRKYTRELERSNQDLSEFASIASHDLQEPLRKIMSFSQRLKKDCSTQLDDRGKDYLRRMERSAKHMQDFVTDLLQYSKVVTASTWRQPVDLKEVISQAIHLLETRIEETRPTIEVGPMPVIEAYRVQMLQLFQNLISNALKFHKKGESPMVKISHRVLENGFHEIRVKDRGIGFDKSQLNRIFKPFERLHGRGEYEGTGMGLTICQKIVMRHGGVLTAESSPDEGATFVVTLPTRRD